MNRDGLSVEHRVALLNKEAKSLIAGGNYEAAVECCNEAIILNDSNLAYLSRSYCFKHLKKWDAAISDFNFLISHDPSQNNYCQRGLCYAKLHNYKSAIEDLCQAYNVKTIKN
jgi:tetratricopeptide (TPR) repeat protein